MKFSVTINRDEGSVWIVECPAIPGCVSQGQTKDEAVPLATSAGREMVDDRIPSPVASGSNGCFTVNLAERRGNRQSVERIDVLRMCLERSGTTPLPSGSGRDPGGSFTLRLDAGAR